MAIVVESGAGLSNAESYVSVADATTYHAARGNAAWGLLASDTIREQLLRKAVDYMTQAYGQRWKGERINSTQALDWPRYDVVANGYYVPSDSVPLGVAHACAELALRAATVSLAPDVTRLKKRVKVGPIETEYEPGSSALPRFTAVDNMLAAYLGGGSMMVAVVRA
ncbi:hypothetical protein J7E62_27700 [Variovorax paradoxus]|nr:hypothetical protein [Variovorax paradoxus]